jgi:hypothetical protein
MGLDDCERHIVMNVIQFLIREHERLQERLAQLNLLVTQMQSMSRYRELIKFDLDDLLQSNHHLSEAERNFVVRISDFLGSEYQQNLVRLAEIRSLKESMLRVDDFLKVGWSDLMGMLRPVRPLAPSPDGQAVHKDAARV